VQPITWWRRWRQVELLLRWNASVRAVNHVGATALVEAVEGAPPSPVRQAFPSFAGHFD
jgi:hypothetical protein